MMRIVDSEKPRTYNNPGLLVITLTSPRNNAVCGYLNPQNHIANEYRLHG